MGMLGNQVAVSLPTYQASSLVWLCLVWFVLVWCVVVLFSLALVCLLCVELETNRWWHFRRLQNVNQNGVRFWDPEILFFKGFCMDRCQLTIYLPLGGICNWWGRPGVRGKGSGKNKAWSGPGLVGMGWPGLATAKHEATQLLGHIQIQRTLYFSVKAQIIK